MNIRDFLDVFDHQYDRSYDNPNMYFLGNVAITITPYASNAHKVVNNLTQIIPHSIEEMQTLSRAIVDIGIVLKEYFEISEVYASLNGIAFIYENYIIEIKLDLVHEEE